MALGGPKSHKSPKRQSKSAGNHPDLSSMEKRRSGKRES